MTGYVTNILERLFTFLFYTCKPHSYTISLMCDSGHFTVQDWPFQFSNIRPRRWFPVIVFFNCLKLDLDACYAVSYVSGKVLDHASLGISMMVHL